MALSEQNVLDADGPFTAASIDPEVQTGPRRLHDLDRRGWLVVLLLVVALAAPFAASVVKARGVDWTPTGDEALITLRVREVFSIDPPLIGQPSTAAQYAEVDPPHHPGPIQFYLLAPFVRMLGADLGMLVGVAVINVISVLTVPWVAFRRAGPLAALGAAVLVSSVAWSQGIAVLTDNISSNAGGIPLLALAALVWGVVDRDIRLLPAAAFAFSFVAQQHLAILGNALGMGAWAGVGLVVPVVIWHRTRYVGDDPADTIVGGAAVSDDDIPMFIDPAEEIVVPEVPSTDTHSDVTQSPWPWVAIAAVVGFISWLPVLVDQFFGQGNLSRMARFASAGERESLGLRSGVTQALRALGLPPLLLRTDLAGSDMIANLTPVAVAVSLVVIAALIAVVVVRRHTSRAHVALAATTLVLAAIGALNGGNVPYSLEAYRINFYRWMFVVSIGVCFTLGWALAAMVSRRLTPLPQWTGALACGVAVVVVAAASVVAIEGGEPQVRRDEQMFADVHRLSREAAAAVEGSTIVYVITEGMGATLSMGPAVVQSLVSDGYDVRVNANQEEGYRSHMVLRPQDQADVVLVVQSAPELDRLSTAGTPLAVYGLNDADDKTLAHIRDAALGSGFVRSGDFDKKVSAAFGDGPGAAEYVEYVVTMFSEGDGGPLTLPVINELIAVGALELPDADPAVLEAAKGVSMRATWGDHYIGLRLLTPTEAGLEPAAPN